MKFNGGNTWTPTRELYLRGLAGSGKPSHVPGPSGDLEWLSDSASDEHGISCVKFLRRLGSYGWEESRLAVEPGRLKN
jgi:hypothetical protein